MRKKSRFCGAFGRNEYGGYNNYYKLMESKPFVIGFKVKKFAAFSDAQEYAIDGFLDYLYEKECFPDIIIPEKLPLNWMVYPKKLTK